ncbi:MAG: transglutaminase domain-containing protein [Gemmatales bacterium]
MSTILDRQLLSLYVTLLLSVGCLGYAELGQGLPETPYLYSLIFVAFGVAYWAEGKHHLTIAASNAVAVGLILAGFGWIILKVQMRQVTADPGNGVVRELVTYTGPILCSLLLAKLFRPKSASDQWLLQLLGLVQVILASVLAMSSRMDRDAPLFPVLMLLYLASLSWALRLFYLRGETDQTSNALKPAPVQLRWFSMIPAGWFLFCMLVAVVIFFCLPHSGTDISAAQGLDNNETGSTSNIDLNADGTIEVSDERVMRIWAKNKNGAVMLPETLRLRGAILSDYNERTKVWRPFPTSMSVPLELDTDPGPLPENGIRFEYDIDVAQIQELGKPRQARFTTNFVIPLFLTDPPASESYQTSCFSTPARSRNRTPLNVNPFEGQSWLSLTQKFPTITVTHDYSGKLNSKDWEQTVRTLPPEYSSYMTGLGKVPRSIDTSGRIAKLSQDILAKNNLPASANDRDKALALEKHLSAGEYTYSLNRRKQDTALDPSEDFLFNVKEGHCERYASALVMMLRSIGIKSRIIIGYRGAEWNELGSFYLIRQLHAHAWVEALVGVETMADGSRKLQWLVLDPTPVTDAKVKDTGYTSPLTFARYLWEFFILDFSGQAQRGKLLAQFQKTTLGQFIMWWLSLDAWQSISLLVGFLFALTALCWLLVRWWRKRRTRHLEGLHLSGLVIPFYQRLLKLLSRRGWKPEPSQTPAEFATHVQYQLLSNNHEQLAGIPHAVISPYYAVRFGGASLDQQQTDSLHQQLQTLQTGLQGAG